MKIKIENNRIYNLLFLLDEKINMKKKEIVFDYMFFHNFSSIIK